jgi:hypothetical protein
MKMKLFFLIFLFVLAIVLSNCKKENTITQQNTNTQKTRNLLPDSIGFVANVITSNSVVKIWKTSSAISNETTPIVGNDYFAIRGGINPYELMLMSFGKFIDDTSSKTGRLTIFIGRVTDIGTFNIDGINSNNVVLSILVGNNFEQYTSDINNTGSVIITKYDTIDKKISGTFSFKLGSRGNIIKVDNGFFTNILFKQ